MGSSMLVWYKNLIYLFYKFLLWNFDLNVTYFFNIWFQTVSSHLLSVYVLWGEECHAEVVPIFLGKCILGKRLCRHLNKCFCFRYGSGEPINDPIADLASEDKLDSDGKDSKRTGQILWIRGLTRLQTQVCCKE